MASPVTVIPNPLDPTQHLLFWLSNSNQLALEQRPLEQSQQFEAYQDFGLPQGNIVNPSSFAAVMHKKLVTVYGITQPGVSDKASYVSKLSPNYNLIATGPVAVAGTPALAACADSDGTDFLYYLQLPTGASAYEILEFTMVGNTGKPSPPLTNATPSKNSNLAAVYFKKTKDRYVFFTNTDKKHFVYSVNTNANAQNQQSISGTGAVSPGSPLAVCSTENKDGTLNVYLYYMDTNQALNRVVGKASGPAGSDITWFKNLTLGAQLKATTLMTAATTGTQNYVYFKFDGQDMFSPFIDPINDDMFQPPPSG